LHRTRPLLLLFAALAAALALVACGDGGGDSDADPQTVLKDTFENDETIQSGVFDLSFDINAEGEGGGNVEVSLAGPFQGGGEGVPQFDVTGDLKAETPQGDLDFTGGLISTGETAFVNFQDTDYEVPQELFDQFATSFEQLQAQGEKNSGQNTNFLKSLGIDPTNWLTDLENDGTEDVEGTETVHVSGTADVPKLLEDIQRIAEQAGPAAQQITPDQIAQVEDSIRSAEFDVYSGVDDNLLRKVSATLEVVPPEGTSGAPENLSIDFSLTFSDVNEEQSISAPENAQPLSGLLEQFGIDPSQLGGALQGGVGGLPQSGGSPQPPTSSSSQAYIECLQTAQGQEALQKCAELIQ
jgi:hypothetical protein